MVKQDVKRVRKHSHLRTEECPWGEFDEISFIPYQDMPVRCTGCSMFMDSTFFDESECPNCHWRFTKSEARDMYVESYAIKVNFGGWTKELLDHVAKQRKCVIVAKDFSMHPVDNVSRNLVSFSIAHLREAERRRAAQQQLIDQIRRQNPVSNL